MAGVGESIFDLKKWSNDDLEELHVMLAEKRGDGTQLPIPLNAIARNYRGLLLESIFEIRSSLLRLEAEDELPRTHFENTSGAFFESPHLKLPNLNKNQSKVFDAITNLSSNSEEAFDMLETYAEGGKGAKDLKVLIGHAIATQLKDPGTEQPVDRSECRSADIMLELANAKAGNADAGYFLGHTPGERALYKVRKTKKRDAGIYDSDGNKKLRSEEGQHAMRLEEREVVRHKRESATMHLSSIFHEFGEYGANLRFARAGELAPKDAAAKKEADETRAAEKKKAEREERRGAHYAFMASIGEQQELRNRDEAAKKKDMDALRAQLQLEAQWDADMAQKELEQEKLDEEKLDQELLLLDA